MPNTLWDMRESVRCIYEILLIRGVWVLLIKSAFSDLLRGGSNISKNRGHSINNLIYTKILSII